MTATDRPLTQHDAALVLAVLDVVAKTAAARLADGKRIAASDYFRRGDRSVVSDPETGERIGLTWMTDPKPRAEIVDRDVLVAWAREERPEEETEEVVTVRAGVQAQVLDVLAAHAPHLLDARWDLTEHGEAAILKSAVRKGADPIPGVEVQTPRGSITVKLDEGGAERVLELIGRKVLDPVRALPAPHNCLTDPEAGFPDDLPDVGPHGRTGDGKRGPFNHACATCGQLYGWRETAGFVVWVPIVAPAGVDVATTGDEDEKGAA